MELVPLLEAAENLLAQTGQRIRLRRVQRRRVSSARRAARTP